MNLNGIKARDYSNDEKSEFNMNSKLSLFDESSDIIISDCLSSLLKNPLKATEIFNQNQISFKNFMMDPWSVINNQNIVFNFKEQIFPIKVGLPIILSKFIYKTDLPDEVLNKLYQNKSYFGIKSNNLAAELKNIKIEKENKLHDLNNKSSANLQDIGFDTINDTNYDINKKPNLILKETLYNKIKSTSPSTEQIKMLDLKKGKNNIKFVCRSRLSGQHFLESEIYLWDKDDKIIISDVDGTITKSDVLGQLMPMFGNDWAQPGVTELFNSIEKNGYKILYLTARAICQSTITKTYLNNLVQNNIKLSKGPLVMSPDGLFTSFKREVIDKTPQVLIIY
jgi:phosphatidate phosphatase LPIN